MKDRITQFFFRRIPLLIFLTFYLLFTIFTYRDYGLTMDEFYVYTRGDYFYHKVKGNDKFLQKGFVVKEYGNENLLYYNSTYPALLYALNDDNSYENYHLLNMLFASLIFVFLYESLLHATNKQWISVLGPVFLFFTPRFLGHIPANPKDIPFAVLYFISLYFIYIQNEIKPSFRTILIGFSIGLTTSLRIVGFTLLPIYFIYTFIQLGKPFFKSKLNLFTGFIFESLQIAVFTLFVLMASIPYIGADPFNHTLELLTISKQYPWNGNIFFLGEVLPESNVSNLYLPIWILISTPVSIIIFSFISIFGKYSKKITSLRILLFISLGIQILMYFVMDPVIYNGLRHYLFILPQVVILAVIGAHKVYKKNKFAKLLLGFVCIDLVVISFFYIRFHPFQYTYFNLFTGSIYNATNYFETDYWAASDKEALLWLKNYAISRQEYNPKIFLCSRSISLRVYYPEALDYNYDSINADYIVCYDKRQLDELKKSVPGEIIHEVTRDGILFNSVYKVL